ncbi:MAG: TauD/TfdA family dioxygenase [Gammaproteobacteria bacterium]|nr:MAG: TauD/TfdA family dioxygenase [Gammaproteobacteria bacterium]
MVHSNAPASYEGPANWRGPNIRNSEDWHINLTKSHISEIKKAVQRSIDNRIPILELIPECFHLPRLAQVLQTTYQELLYGRGFVVFHGMPVQDLNREEIIRAYVGIGSWLGEPVPQNQKGHILGHVKDIGFDHTNPQTRIYGTSYRQLYHTDGSDLVGLLCLQKAKSGGVFSLASSVAIFNEIARRRPDLAKVLSSPFVVDRKGEVPDGKQDTYEIEIFHHYKHRLLTIHDRVFINAAQHRDYVPRLTDQQIEALDLLDDLAGSEEFRLDYEWQQGDMNFAHNHQILHARTGYEDYPELDRKRHLLRLWLSTKDGWELPPIFAEKFGTVERGQRRGGIHVPGMKLTVPFEAE